MFKLNYPNFWKKKGLFAFLLLPFTPLYRIGTFLRKITSKEIIFNSKVICVGNATVGGTGKTQIVAWLAKYFKSQNKNFIIVTKGYRSSLQGARLVTLNCTAAEVGDESVILREFGPVVATKSYKFLPPIIEKLKPDIIIFDDGLQNPYFHKDFIIMVIDGLRGFGNGFLLPAGPMRVAPKAAIEKSNCIITVEEGFSINFNKPQFKAHIKGITEVNPNKNYLAFSGIGNNAKFFASLKKLGIKVVKEISFPDHYQYLEEDIISLKKIARTENLCMITSEKDFVKLPDQSDIIYFKVEIVIEKEDKLFKLLHEKNI